MKIELTKKLRITTDEEAKLRMHSFINLMNVITGKLFILGIKLGDDKLFLECIDACRAIAENIVLPECNIKLELDVQYLKQIINKKFAEAENKLKNMDKHLQLIRHYRNMIHEFLDVARERCNEIIIRENLGEKWENLQLQELEHKIKQVFDAMALNSQNRFGIVYNRRDKTKNDYFIDFYFKTLNDESLTMPPELHDVLRDLTANARKYSQPGNDIKVKLTENETDIRLVVSDNGRGIPEADLEYVVDFGHRAQNVKKEETKGGGFGLTKAYYVTKKNKGRMWIDSEPGKGTTICILIPKDEEKASYSSLSPAVS